MELDAVSRIIGNLEASQAATTASVGELKAQVDAMDGKLDKLLARSERTRLTLRHWMMMFAAGGSGGGLIHAALKAFGK